MSEAPPDVPRLVDHLFRSEYGKMVAVLTRAFGVHQLSAAEDLVQETLITAMHQFTHVGVPDNPAAWLMQVARNKALNHVKREALGRRVQEQATEPQHTAHAEACLRGDIEDSVLSMIFACCHPDIEPEDRVVLVLKVICGLGVREIARGLLSSEAAIEKRMTRAKRRLSQVPDALQVPGGEELGPRLSSVCTCLYLLYNEGYSASSGEEAIRRDLCFEATRLCKLLSQRFPEHAEALALLALMYLHAARFDARLDDGGAPVLFEDQDRARWDRRLIAEGLQTLAASARGDQLTRYHLEASIAAQHCMAPSLAATQWATIEELYAHLYEITPSPVLLINLAIVHAYTRDLPTAIAELQALETDPRLAGYPHLHTALGELYRRWGDGERARASFEKALQHVRSERERAFLHAKLATLITA